jgi:hypothetical protein
MPNIACNTILKQDLESSNSTWNDCKLSGQQHLWFTSNLVLWNAGSRLFKHSFYYVWPIKIKIPSFQYSVLQILRRWHLAVLLDSSKSFQIRFGSWFISQTPGVTWVYVCTSVFTHRKAGLLNFWLFEPSNQRQLSNSASNPILKHVLECSNGIQNDCKVSSQQHS